MFHVHDEVVIDVSPGADRLEAVVAIMRQPPAWADGLPLNADGWTNEFFKKDYGTLNPFSAGLWCLSGGVAVRIREYYYDSRKARGQKTDEEYYAELVELAGNLPVERIVVDPSAASFIETIRRHGRYAVRKARNEVLPGIRLTSTLLKSGRVKIHSGCADALRELGLYRWDEKGEVDKPLKENDHAADDIRYFCATVLRRELRRISELRGLGYE